MKIKWLGHSSFRITTNGGTVIITDPFDASVGYKITGEAADIVTESHQHHDHNAAETLSRADRILAEACDIMINDVHISTCASFHDDVQGTKRGPNLLFSIEADGKRIVHLGDLGHMPDDDQIAWLQGADIMLIPVGGFYTIDGIIAAEVVKKTAPKTVVPMHYLTPAMHFPITDEKVFTDIIPCEHIHAAEFEVSDDLPGGILPDYE